MPIPPFHAFMRPLLEKSRDAGGPIRIADLEVAIARDFGLSEQDIAEQIPSGGQSLFRNRLNWAKTYLGKAGLLAFPKRSYFGITEKGLRFLETHQGPILPKDLLGFPEFRTWARPGLPDDPPAGTEPGARPPASGPVPRPLEDYSPDDLLSEGEKRLREQTRKELLERLRTIQPRMFERVVLDLLGAMGFGGSSGRAIQTPYTHDGGIDGIVEQDALGLDSVSIQAKRYTASSVPTDAVKAFVGAMEAHAATKGVFVTTASFPASARQFVRMIAKRVSLIDGERLAELCMRHGVGVRAHRVIRIARIDEDYFADEA